MRRFGMYLTAVAAMALASCTQSGSDRSALPESTGSPYELIAVVPQALWETPAGDSLKTVYTEAVQHLSQYEPQYTLMHVTPNTFTGFLQKHRNIVTMTVNEELDSVRTAAAYDMTARPQLRVALSGPDVQSLTDYISDNREGLQGIFEIAERNRYVANAERFNQEIYSRMISDMCRMSLPVPTGYAMRGKLHTEDMIVFSYEYPVATQGFAVYTYPYSDRTDLQKESIIARRNGFMANIPGPSEGSFMTTSEAADPQISYMTINGRPWAEVYGLWETENDYMGGPFVSYTTVDMETRMVVCIDCYVYAPRDDKRNMLRNLEHLVFTASFPDDSADSAAE